MAKFTFEPVILTFADQELFFVNREAAEDCVDLFEIVVNDIAGVKDPAQDEWRELIEDEDFAIDDMHLWLDGQSAANSAFRSKT